MSYKCLCGNVFTEWDEFERHYDNCEIALELKEKRRTEYYRHFMYYRLSYLIRNKQRIINEMKEKVRWGEEP